MFTTVRLTALVLVLGVTTRASAWVATLPGQSDQNAAGWAIAADASGDVVVAGTLAQSHDSWLGIAKFDGASGAHLWDTAVVQGRATGVVLVPGDIVVAAGTQERFFDGIYIGSAFAVTSLDASTGAVTSAPSAASGQSGSWLAGAVAIPPSSPVVFGTDSRLYVSRVGSWEQHVSAFELDGTPGGGQAYDAVVDAGGDVLVTGVTYSLKPSSRPNHPPAPDVPYLVVAKLSGSDGSVLWQYVYSETSAGTTLALDASGNVIVGGVAASTTGGTIADDMFVAALDTDGNELWHGTIDGGANSTLDAAFDVAVDGSGDVIVAGRLAISPNDPLFYGGLGEFAVLKLAAADGAEQWRYTAPNTTLIDSDFLGGTKGEARAIVLDQDGDPVVAGATNASWIESGVNGHIADFTVVKLSDATGAQQQLWVPGAGFAYTAGATADGIVAAGRLNRTLGDGSVLLDFAVVKLVDGIAGTKVALRDGPDPARRRLKLTSKDRGVTSPFAGRYGDPTFDGGRIVLVDPATATEQAIDLPAAGWRAIPGGYEYRDRLAACPLVQVRRNKGVVAKCAGAQVHLPTGRATRDNLGVRVEIGPARAAEYCAEFGGVVQRDDGENFRAKAAPAPGRCRAD